jgi:TonB-dependent SusC/RagA subfamily outer membrane receptor
MLGEVIVSTGYQELPKERATGSFVAVDKALLNRSVSTDIVGRLRDVVPGLSFNTLGTRISIRGQSTLFSNAQPLIVVDGFPYNQPVENLNPADVRSITVLRDAAAASIWGARAGNGVIVITTNKGAFDQPMRVSLSANINARRPARPVLPAQDEQRGLHRPRKAPLQRRLLRRCRSLRRQPGAVARHRTAHREPGRQPFGS